jgi:hypothetical protein
LKRLLYTLLLSVFLKPLITFGQVSSYAFSQPITLNTSGSGIGTTPLVNFPALVYIKEDAIKAGVNCGTNIKFPSGGTNGYDFAFTLSGISTELFYQVESYDPATGTLLAWVQIPSVTSTNTALTFYFGSLSPAHTASFTNATWSNDYQAVYHFNDANTTVLDATGNSKTATATDATTTTSGKITSAYIFNGTSTKVISTAAATITGPFTLSAWAYVNNFTTSPDQKIVTNQVSYTTGGYKMGFSGTSAANVKAEVETRTNTGTATLNRNTAGGTVVTTGSWHLVHGIYNGTNFISYLDGAPDRTDVGAVAGTGGPIYIGSDFGTANWFNGTLDEIRISNVAKSADWMKLEYFNQNNPTTFTNSATVITPVAANVKAIGGALVYTWTGTTSTATNVAGNWRTPASGNPVATIAPVIDGTISLVIPNVTNKPILSANAAFYGLTLDAGSSFNLNGNTLTVGCNIYNNGTINPAGVANNSTVIFNGTYTPQLYTGTNVAGTAQFGNITINNTASSGIIRVTGGPIDLYNTLTLTTGSMDINNAGNGAFTLKSSGTQTARVAEITTGAVTGNVNAERFVTGGPGYNNTRKNWTYRNYRIMSSPVYTATSPANVSSLGYIVASSIVTGATCPTCTTSSTGNPTLYLYREDFAGTKLNFNSSNFRGITNITTEALTVNGETGSKYLYPGTGFLFYFRGNRTTNAAAKIASPYVAPESVVFTNTGILNQGSIPVKNWQTGTTTLLGTTTSSVASARGLNLVGNPYASSIDWDNAAGFTTTNISTSIYIFNAVTNQYDTYVRNTGGAGTGASNGDIIASGQAFFVKVNTIPGTGSFTFNESAKSATQLTSGSTLLLSNGIKKAESPVSFIRVRLTLDSLNHDNVVMVFRDGTNEKYIADEDGIDMGGSGSLESLSALSSDNISLAVSAMPLPKTRRVIPLSVDATSSGLYSLGINEIKNMPAITQVWLKDNWKKDSLNLRLYPTYNFNIDKNDAATYGNNRFQIVIRQNPALALKLLDINANKIAEGAKVEWVTENESNYTNFTIERSTDKGTTFEVIGGFLSSQLGTYNLVDKNPLVGLNQYRLKMDDLNGALAYSKVVELMYSKDTDKITVNNITVFPNPTTDMVNIKVITKETKATYNIKITDAIGTVVKKATSSKSTWRDNVSDLKPGTYYIQVINNTTKVIAGTAKFIKL